MGANCGKNFPYPCPDNQCNICNVSLGAQMPDALPNFCTLRGFGGNNQRATYCQKMSKAGEWGDPFDIHNGCKYNDCNNYQQVETGCCDGCCGIIGGGLLCTRQSFTGDPLTCCLNDYSCNSTNSACFSDDTQQNTCADGTLGTGSFEGQYVPNYRSLVSPDCQDVFLQYCTGNLPDDDQNSTDWLDRWTTNNGGIGSCANILARNMFATSGHTCGTVPPITPGICSINPPLPINSQGYFWAQNLVSETMAKYAAQGFEIGTLPGFPGYNPFQDFLYSNVCCPYPGLCQDGLNIACARYTSQRISLNPAVSQWCGCHLPDAEYQSYSAKYNIPPECTPMCNRSGTIPIIGINATPVLCKQNICLIDGVTVNLINAQIGGGIDFDQVCGNCGGGAQCSCIVSDTTVDISNSTIGGNVIPVSEGCGALTCSQTNPGTTGPSTITVPCGTTAGFNPYAQYEAEVAAAQAAAKKDSFLITLIIIGAALVIIFLIILFIHPNLYPSSGRNISRYKPSNQQFESASFFQSIEPVPSTETSFSQTSSTFRSIEEVGTGGFSPSSSSFSSIESTT